MSWPEIKDLYKYTNADDPDAFEVFPTYMCPEELHRDNGRFYVRQATEDEIKTWANKVIEGKLKYAFWHYDQEGIRPIASDPRDMLPQDRLFARWDGKIDVIGNLRLFYEDLSGRLKKRPENREYYAYAEIRVGMF